MRKLSQLLFTAVVICCFITACKKTEDVTGPASDTWEWNGHVFHAGKTYLSIPGASPYAASLNALDDAKTPENVLHVDFVRLPTQPGPLRIVREPHADDEIRIYVYGTAGNNKSYMSKADINSSAYVYFVNGKMSLLINNAFLPEFTFADTAAIRLSAAITVQ